jgi:hypothetical protein
VLLFCLAHRAAGKTVHLEWQPIEAAVGYEIVIANDEKPIVQKRLTLTRWEGELENGYYQYRIRAIDWVGRAGPWSPPLSLVVMPSSPQLEIPSPGSTVKTRWSDPGVAIRWKAATPGTPTRVEVRAADGKVVYSEIVGVEAIAIPDLAPGAYTVSLRSAIGSFAGDREWESASSTESRFTIERVPLDPPELISPVDEKIESAPEPTVELRWQGVAGARGYFVRWAEQGAEAPPTPPEWAYTDELSRKIALPGRGQYRWEVVPCPFPQAAAGKQPGAELLSSLSQADFEVIPPRLAAGQLEASAGFSIGGAEYRVTDLVHHQGADASPDARQFRGNFEYWFSKHFSVGADLGAHWMNLAPLGTTVFFDADFLARARFRLFGNFVVRLALGFGLQELPEIQSSPSFNGPSPAIPTGFKMLRALDLRLGPEFAYAITPRWRVALQFLAVTPFLAISTFSDTSLGYVSPSAEPTLSLTHFFNESWGVALAVRGTSEDLSLKSRANNLTDEVHFGATDFSLLLAYRLGN